MDKSGITTSKLLDIINKSNSFEDVIEAHHLDTPGLGSYLMNLLHEHSITPSNAIEKTNLSKSFFYQILSGTRTPSRDILIRIALAIGETLEQTQKMLTISQRGTLYPRIRRDAAIIFCLQKKCTLERTNELLEEIGETPLIARSMDE